MGTDQFLSQVIDIQSGYPGCTAFSISLNTSARILQDSLINSISRCDLIVTAILFTFLFRTLLLLISDPDFS